ncbi:phosphomannomutase CpsG [Marinicellulosiphila megalodicopiae]|uniref:phosphomannomutase CpsG n=1 Tax=Marinicellulosiphila megalodicopiae TaxID=2724896 RepID=UPI003BB0AD09
MSELTCFKAYDIRGKLGTELDTSIAYRIGCAYAQVINPTKVVVGEDVRATSNEIKNAFAQGLMDMGVDVLDIGLCGTEEIYFATKFLGISGGAMITASHNPIDYNGLKLVREDSKPVSNDTGLLDIKLSAEKNDFTFADVKGTMSVVDTTKEYIEHLIGYVAIDTLKPMRIVVNGGNGAAAPTLDRLEVAFKQKNIPIEFIKMNHEPDSTFPNGIPNPLLHEQQAVTGDQVKAHKADLGIAWDGDFDRCFLWDSDGRFIEGYYIVGLLAEAFLLKNPGASIIHDPRLLWNTIDIVEQNGGKAIQSQTGHAYIKEIMRKEDAVYGGEMSAHHYFKDFAYCDSGMIPWLLVVDLLSRRSTDLQTLVSKRMTAYPSPGEINRKVADADVAIVAVRAKFEADSIAIDTTDGVSLSFEQWRFNLRKSNTEPVVRLNLETRGDAVLMQAKTDEILAILDAHA